VAPRSPGGAGGYAARALALLVCLGSVAGMVRLAQQSPATSAPGAATASADGGDCATRKRAEIEREKAAGRLTAEQAMIRRQKIARECG
jgi:hypothetical protein